MTLGAVVAERSSREQHPTRGGGVVITMLNEARLRPRRVAMGKFDGVHLGHREVIAGSDTVLTFNPHPLQVIRPEAAPKLLSTLEVKAELMAGLGVEELVVVPFDHRFAQRSAREFIDEVLVEHLGAEVVSVGQNFRFGHRAAGDPELLARDARFRTRVVPLVEVEGEAVSSSRIRGLIQRGEVELAGRFLGAPFQIEGQVLEADRHGRTLGFPTWKIAVDEPLVCPARGTYAAYVDGIPAVVTFGVRSTFAASRGLGIEAYLIDHSVELTGRRLRIKFLGRLHSEQYFSSARLLSEQIQEDAERTRTLLAPRSA